VTGVVLLEIYVFVLACFAGYQLIAKVPPTLHTPLMSGANAIAGIALLGAMEVAAVAPGRPFATSTIVGTVAVALASLNVVGGFWVTGRMLRMFKKD
jgi:H+-translocating NAD(P) transhydrogenase subunit alpha